MEPLRKFSPTLSAIQQGKDYKFFICLSNRNQNFWLINFHAGATCQSRALASRELILAHSTETSRILPKKKIQVRIINHI